MPGDPKERALPAGSAHLLGTWEGARKDPVTLGREIQLLAEAQAPGPGTELLGHLLLGREAGVRLSLAGTSFAALALPRNQPGSSCQASLR